MKFTRKIILPILLAAGVTAGCGTIIRPAAPVAAPATYAAKTPAAPATAPLVASSTFTVEAAQLAWDNQSFSDQVLVCGGYNADPVGSAASFMRGYESTASDPSQAWAAWASMNAVLANAC